MPFLQFKGKTAIESYHYTIPHHTLEFDTHLSLLPDQQEPGLDGNLIIEGDNLLALKSLLPTHANRIRCVYIDPPYNTGNEGWVYNDNLTQPQFKEWIGETVGKEGDDMCRHDKWCCMMYPRLQLLKQLLREDGVIFVSIDDNEIGNLRGLMDEVFDGRWLGTFVWKKRSGSNDSKEFVSVDHEYVVVYCKSDTFKFNGTPKDFRNYSNPDNDPRGEWAVDNLTCNKTCEERENLCYDITDPKTGIVYPVNPNRVWAYEPERMARIISEDKVIFPKSGQGTPQYKRHRKEVRSETKPVSTWIETTSISHDDLEAEQEEASVSILQTQINSQATKELRQIFGSQMFNYPKPMQLVRELINQATKAGDIILDSFAGSGTTAHAALDLNKADRNKAEAGKEENPRKFVLVQQRYDSREDEKKRLNICEKVTSERVRRVITGYEYQKTQRTAVLDSSGNVQTIEKKQGKQRVEGLGGSFTYTRVSEKPLFGAYRDLGKQEPSWENLAAYIFYTEANCQFDRHTADPVTGKIGTRLGNSYYLLYAPDEEAGRGLDIHFLQDIAALDSSKNIIVYSEKFVLHRDTLHKWEIENHKKVRSMLVPFNLR